ncbi:MAG: hypothetical protein HYY93_16180 [Planctomycetes bacterium]|nr:hypothetical protein [Planctomycetota bacterium]
MAHVGDITLGSPSRATAPSALERSKLTREQFLKILTAQMSKQDPLNPITDQDFIGQMASLQNLEAVSALTEGIKSMQKSQEIGAASALIGKTIRGTSDSRLPIQGVVSQVTINGAEVRLVVDGETVSMDNVTEIAPTFFAGV